MNRRLVGRIVGYDPGGNNRHGVAIATVRKSEKNHSWTVDSVACDTCSDVGSATDWLVSRLSDAPLVAVGVDTLTAWNDGRSGLRPADLWLRKRYPEMSKSVIAPNCLRGSMAISGIVLLRMLASSTESAHVVITEAHPKVCYFALTRAAPNWPKKKAAMRKWLQSALHPTSSPTNDHEFDALVAVLAAYKGLNGDWTTDLHAIVWPDTGQPVSCMKTHYWWPEA